jgi:hypothetical protein
MTGTDHRMRLVDEQNQVRPLFELADHVLNPSSNIRQHRPAAMAFIWRLTTWQSRRRTGTLSGSN